MEKFKEPSELADWLNAIGIDVSSWGTGANKTIENLWEEYVRGEISFQPDPPVRRVEVVRVMVIRGDMTLLEIEQEFINGERRARNQPPSEKRRPSEDVRDAAVRCLVEELDVSGTQIEFVSSDYKVEEQLIDSPSYPGLPTYYQIHTLETRVLGLPDESFWRDNAAVGEGDPVKRHLWSWVLRP